MQPTIQELIELTQPQQDERRYVLVDLAQLTPEQLRLLPANGLPASARLFSHDPILEGQRDIGPALLDLTGAEDPAHDSHALFASLAESGHTTAQASWLTSAARQDLLAQHFARYLKVALPDQRRALLRFYDAWLLPRFVRVLSPAQWDDFMRYTSRWHAMQPDGAWADLHQRPAQFAVESGDAPPAAPIAPATPWPMSEIQHQMMVYAGLPGSVMRRYFDEHPKQAAQRTRAEIYGESTQTMRAAARHGVGAIDDLEAIMMIGLLNGPAFADLPAVREQLARLESGAEFEQVLTRLAVIRS
ncbi:hypothetical protein LMG28688_05711 [Paraburkholderia caffeinitolerans]|uniref:DUF4123 domain-containing protein n=1 Tax=Paraburkholderia caffeinitolerans TaxID=1723730 RepID=A0A6J5GSW9_9BURK|nr:DUF4123 domain-containing protein [Paraburkholderia caffeinitolerans]CAB3803127.1 hypothetical protein LMG28688_05711 [Paraburkholderia caffeinitolerans]